MVRRSNVWEYFDRVEPKPGSKYKHERYRCKICHKYYARHAGRLADHLREKCARGFQVDDGPSKKVRFRQTLPPLPKHGKCDVEDEGETKEEDGDAATQTRPRIKNTTELLLRLAKLTTGVIGDAMTELNIQGCFIDVSLIEGYDAPLAMNVCGPALTVKMMPSTGVTPPLNGSFNYTDTAEVDQVVVISSPPGITTAVFGGLLANASKVRNLSGVVTDGRVRDVPELCAMNFPAFATGTSTYGVYESVVVGEVNSTIVIGGCVVRPLDIIRGDINGVVVIPRERGLEVALRAEIIEDQDNKIAEALSEGEPLQTSLRRFPLVTTI
ncbi:Protein DlpA [Phytophthora citrophthora]|uniref:Protein DlpA n=1 Tax=Phytophthora citrophthora TaxID=4793 RepID=A0AAD9LQZ0_9STRA|nr:Protein DlpA [Phytophthora citrophthora]